MPIEIRELVIKVTVAESRANADLEKLEQEVVRLKKLFENDMHKLRTTIKNRERQFR